MGEWEFIHMNNPEAVLSECDQPTAHELQHESEAAKLRHRWNTLYKEILPALARSKDPIQPHWPVQLNHCFARIIYDAVIGFSRNPDSSISGPWTDRLEAPAVKNMHPDKLKECIELGEQIASGKVNLVELDRLSLAVRGKLPKEGKRKRERPSEDATQDKHPKKPKPSSLASKSSTQTQPTIRSAMGALSPKAPSSPAQINPDLSSKITLHPTLTPFRKRVLLALCQVPEGQYTTYLALSNYLHSCPRAVGNALRNNPFAPTAPCHRVMAADGGIGGFGGEWGVQGRHNGEKVRLLRGEGVAVGKNDSRVMGRVWAGFV